MLVSKLVSFAFHKMLLSQKMVRKWSKNGQKLVKTSKKKVPNEILHCTLNPYVYIYAHVYSLK